MLSSKNKVLTVDGSDSSLDSVNPFLAWQGGSGIFIRRTTFGPFLDAVGFRLAAVGGRFGLSSGFISARIMT